MRLIANMIAGAAASLLVAFLLFQVFFDRPVPMFFVVCSGALGLVIGVISLDANREESNQSSGDQKSSVARSAVVGASFSGLIILAVFLIIAVIIGALGTWVFFTYF